MGHVLFVFALGAAAGLLFAPGTGRSSRARLRDKAIKCGTATRDFVRSKLCHMKNVSEGYGAKARELTSSMTEAGGT